MSGLDTPALLVDLGVLEEHRARAATFRRGRAGDHHAGSKALTSDPVARTPDAVGHGLILEYPDATIYGLSEEHGHVGVSGGCASPSVGEVVTIIPKHACGAVDLYDEVTLTCGREPVAVWPIPARGRSC